MRLLKLTGYGLSLISLTALTACATTTQQPTMKQVEQEQAMRMRTQNQRASELSNIELERCDPEKDCPISPKNDNRGE